MVCGLIIPDGNRCVFYCGTLSTVCTPPGHYQWGMVCVWGGEGWKRTGGASGRSPHGVTGPLVGEGRNLIVGVTIITSIWCNA